ncbi:MAG: hypothetical protein MR571_07005 [Succinatimonas sp.]|nr:hypothetical protein [Succinatimonas sp.]
MNDPNSKRPKPDKATLRSAWWWCTLQDLCDKGYVIFIVVSVLFLAGLAIFALGCVISLFFDGRSDLGESILLGWGLMFIISRYMIRSNDKTQGLYKDKKNKDQDKKN